MYLLCRGHSESSFLSTVRWWESQMTWLQSGKTTRSVKGYGKGMRVGSPLRIAPAERPSTSAYFDPERPNLTSTDGPAPDAELTFPAPILPFPNAAADIIASFLHGTGAAPRPGTGPRPPNHPPPGWSVSGVARALGDMGTCRVSKEMIHRAIFDLLGFWVCEARVRAALLESASGPLRAPQTWSQVFQISARYCRLLLCSARQATPYTHPHGILRGHAFTRPRETCSMRIAWTKIEYTPVL